MLQPSKPMLSSNLCETWDLKFNETIKGCPFKEHPLTFLVTQIMDYMSADGTNAFTPEECEIYNRLTEECFDICEKEDADIYEIAFELLKTRWSYRLLANRHIQKGCPTGASPTLHIAILRIVNFASFYSNSSFRVLKYGSFLKG